jgi:drug/metabolite transporter (DMT)-like permease
MALPLSLHRKAVLQALFVAFLWSTSWVLIKFGLQDIPALTFAGLRYSLAFVFLVPFALRRPQIDKLRALPAHSWLQLVSLGLIFYALAQGAQFLSLVYLPAVTTSPLLSFTPVLVALLGIRFLNERPTTTQWLGSGLYLLGVSVYFYPIALQTGQLTGVMIAVVCVIANAVSAILGRSVNRTAVLDPVIVTVVSMGIGGGVLLASGLAVQGLPRLTLWHWLIIFWLALVNSAFAFTLWNRTLRTLSAIESSIINNTMLFQIALLAWIFLGEYLNLRETVGMLVAALGTILVQLRK